MYPVCTRGWLTNRQSGGRTTRPLIVVVRRTGCRANAGEGSTEKQTVGPPQGIEIFWVAFARWPLYGERMARLISTTVRLEEEDVRALKRARAAGYSASELIRKGLRVVASRYYTGRRAPSTRLFESTDSKLGDESELFRDLEG